ncbi:MAG TPA: phosphatase PAP2 family protein [Actinomycetota bacterium]|nr:phosphatase PAP2 family protein [Actinomycetota bacterium]
MAIRSAPAGETAAPFAAAEKPGSKKRRRPSGEPPPLPRHLYASGKYWLGLVGVSLIAWTILFVVQGTGASATRLDMSLLHDLAELRTEWMTKLARALHALGSEWFTRVLRWAVLIALVALKRFRHLFVYIGSLLAVGLVTTLAAQAIARPRPLEIEILGHWQGGSQPSRPVAALAVTLLCIAYTLVVPGRARTIAKWVTGVLLAALAFARLYLAVDHPSDVIVGIIFGVAVPLAAFRMLTPNDVFPVTYKRRRAAHLDIEGERGEAIRSAVESQLGITLVDVEQFGLGGSAGSTPLRLTLAGEPSAQLFAKLYAQNHLRADRWYKLGRTLLYGRLEDEASFNTVRRLVQYEDYLLRVMRDAGLNTPKPYGFVEITPEREYLLVTDFVSGGTELGDADCTDEIVDECLNLIRCLWDSGIAHRDIKPSNLLVAHGKVHLIDVAFGEVRPSPWRQAVDLANMMLVLALRRDAETVYHAALKHFSPHEIAEAFAATHGVTIPSQSRSWMKKDGRDLVRQFRHLAPKRPPIAIQRWSVRRVGLTIGIAFLAFLTVTLAFSNFRGAGLWAPREGTPAAYSGMTGEPACGPNDEMILISQSVPTAEILPCLKGLPVGWSFAGMDVSDGRTRMFFDSDRAGFRAVDLTFTASCDTTGATEVLLNDEPGTKRFERVILRADRYVGSRYYTLAGGCVRYDFDLTGPGRTTLADEISTALTFVEKAPLVEVLERRTGFTL